MEGVDAAILQTTGIGWQLRPRIQAAVRVPFTPTIRQWCLQRRFAAADTTAPDIVVVAETALEALRQVLAQARIAARDLFICGLLEPLGTAGWWDWVEVAARVAEQTGCTVVHSLRQRDRAAGGSGRMLTALADYLMVQHLPLPRLWIHLGHVTTILYLPAPGEIKELFGFEAGPGNQWLDAVIYYGTHGRECCDAGGKRAVQGHCWEPLLQRWLEHPYLTRRPPKTLTPDTFGRAFLLSAFSTARSAGLTLADLLCTATHWIARTLAQAIQQWLPAAVHLAPILVSGGGVRNGFLWQLLSQQLPAPIQRSDQAGVPFLARTAAAAAILATLTCDGITGQAAYLTGAHGGRWLGSFCPGNPRHWYHLSAWVADQTRDLAQLRVA
jgi:anhydro-N-acetylmuramic acid kinase